MSQIVVESSSADHAEEEEEGDDDDESRRLLKRLNCIAHETRYTRRSNPRLWIPIEDDEETHAGVWILRAIDKTGKCHMDVLESWIAWFACPLIGIAPLSMDEWTQSPLRLPDFLVYGTTDGTDIVRQLSKPMGENDASSVVSLQHSPLQQLVDALWKDANASQWGKTALQQSMYMNRTGNNNNNNNNSNHNASKASSSMAAVPTRMLRRPLEEASTASANHPPLPPNRGNGNTPQLLLERVRLQSNQLLLYDCWHILSYRPSEECQTECVPEISYLALSPFDMSEAERNDYVDCIDNVCGTTPALETALSGIPIAHPDSTVQELPVFAKQFQTHGYAVVTVPNWTRPEKCPCQSMAHWLQRVSCDPDLQNLFMDAFRAKGKLSTNARLTLMVRIDDADVRLKDAVLGLYLPHQDPDIPLPPELDEAIQEKEADARRDYTHYRPVLKTTDPNAVIESFTMLTLDDEAVLLDDLANATTRSQARIATTAAAASASASAPNATFQASTSSTRTPLKRSRKRRLEKQ
jgi:hypothetical protein